jgi:8-oxo-dGTP diphosphatase
MNKFFQKVVAAIIFDEQENILITKRMPDSHLGGYWEFPGGQVEENESEEQALRRELKEETGLDICIVQKFREERFEYDIKFVHLIFYICRLCPAIQDVEKRQISDFRWAKKDRLSKYKFPPADEAIIGKLLELQPKILNWNNPIHKHPAQ